jgi:hypothetical protein
MVLRRFGLTMIGAVLVASAPPVAWAYRPFDGTDAAVADLHEVVESDLHPTVWVD